MTTSEWIAILSVSIIVIGWFLNSELNRRNEIAKKRLEFRLNTLNLILDSIVNIYKDVNTPDTSTNNNNLIIDFDEAITRLAIFGKEDEKELCRTISIKKTNKQSFDLELTKLIEIVSIRIKNELKFK